MTIFKTRQSWRRAVAITAVLTGALAVGVAAGLAWAQERGQRGPGPGGSPLFQALDANHDGVIAADELSNATALLGSLDRNQDGALGVDEFRPAFGPGGREGRGPRGGRGGEPGETAPTSPDGLVAALMAFDANADGTLAWAEVPARMQGLFDRADADKNGQLTEAELKASASAQPDPGGAARGEPGERGERGDSGGGGRRGRGPGGAMRGDPLVTALDANRDGTIGVEELAGASASLKALDTDGDGQLSMEEVRPGSGRDGRGPRPGPAERSR